jgi:hypothetical protein
MRGGELFHAPIWKEAMVSSELAESTSESEFGLLPSPNHRPPNWENLEPVDCNGNPPTHWNQRWYDKKTGRLLQKGVYQALTLLPTPTANENDNRRNQPIPAELEGRHGWALMSAILVATDPAYLLPTPTASDAGVASVLNGDTVIRYNSKGTARKVSNQGVEGSLGLSRFAALLPTPTARDWKEGSAAQVEKPRSEALRDRIQYYGQLLATPQARDWKGKSGQGFIDRGGNQNLPSQFHAPKKSLNPRFVAAMMGYHPRWTDTSSLTLDYQIGYSVPQSPSSLGSLVMRLEAFREKIKLSTDASTPNTKESADCIEPS